MDVKLAAVAAEWRATTPAQTEQCAALLAPHFQSPMRIFLSGELGAGKTFWVRAVLRALGEGGRVPSPSYALAYSYTVGEQRIHHLDCFRLQGAAAGGELLELLDDQALCFVEWPECAANLPPADLSVRFHSEEDADRRLCFAADGDKGRAAVRALQDVR